MATQAVVTVNQAVREIDNYIRNIGGSYSQWYVGIASNPRSRLIEGHNVDIRYNCIALNLATSREARTVEAFFLEKGCDGGTGGGDFTTRSVYAFHKTHSTNPSL